MSNFQQLLQVGENFENRYAMPFLLSAYPDYWMEATHDYKVGQYVGPRIQRFNHQHIVLPDFRLFNPLNGHNIMFEAKFKSKPFSIKGQTGKSFIAIEHDKVKQYQTAAEIYRSDLRFIIGCESLGSMHICDNWIFHYFSNSFYTGTVCAFELNDSNKVSVL